MKFKVVTSASRPHKLMPKYLNHMDIGGIPFEVYPIEINHSMDGTMGLCVNQWRLIASEQLGCDRLILTDAWDVMTWSTKEEIEQRLSEFPPDVVFAAERNPWPDAGIVPWVEHKSPWKYVNGGMLTGSPEKILAWCDDVERHTEYAPGLIGQEWLNRRLADRKFPIRLDRGTRLFYCMQLEKNELHKKDGRMWNSVLDTYPLFAHFNGNWPWDGVIQMMEGK